MLEKIKQKADESGTQHSGLYLDGLRQSLWRSLECRSELIEGIRLLADMDLQAHFAGRQLRDWRRASRSATCSMRCTQVLATLRSGCICTAVPMMRLQKFLRHTDSGCRRLAALPSAVWADARLLRTCWWATFPRMKLLEALKQRDVAPPVSKPITEPFRLAVDIASRFSGPKM